MGHSTHLLLALALLAGSVQAKDQELKEAQRPNEVKPGQSALLKSPKGVYYFLRVPKKYKAKDGARLIVFLHGSNMNGLSYLRSFEAKRWAHDAILCCPNGETGKGDPYGANNFTFSSGPLVAEITKLVQEDFKTTVTYVGGHSQGGFLTFSVIMNFPELYHGAIPMAGDCWMQNEPNLWEDKPERMALQRKIGIAVIHGRADPVVKFAQGQHAYDVFRAMGYPKLRLFAPERLGHQFMLSPVDDALEWLEAMNGRQEKDSFKLAAKWAKKGEYGWALQAAKALEAGGGKSAQTRAAKIVARCEAAAQKAVAAMQKRMEGKAEAWIPEWLEFWRIYGGTDAARALVKQYEEKREEQRETGARLFQQASSLLRSQRKAEGHAVLKELLEAAPFTYHAYYAWKWLAER
ncbi:MAG: alpha/beta hydrolase [Planctomycetota bacterium]|jgi:predicted esterase